MKKLLFACSLLILIMFVVSCAPSEPLTDEELEEELAKLTPEERQQLMADLEVQESGALAGQAIKFKPYAKKISPRVLNVPKARLVSGISKFETASDGSVPKKPLGDIEGKCEASEVAAKGHLYLGSGNNITDIYPECLINGAQVCADEKIASYETFCLGDKKQLLKYHCKMFSNVVFKGKGSLAWNEYPLVDSSVENCPLGCFKGKCRTQEQMEALGLVYSVHVRTVKENYVPPTSILFNKIEQIPQPGDELLKWAEELPDGTISYTSPVGSGIIFSSFNKPLDHKVPFEVKPPIKFLDYDNPTKTSFNFELKKQKGDLYQATAIYVDYDLDTQKARFIVMNRLYSLNSELLKETYLEPFILQNGEESKSLSQGMFSKVTLKGAAAFLNPEDIRRLDSYLVLELREGFAN